MNNNDLKRFARQLSIWTELVIEHGRTPFRRVDLFPRLNTRKGYIEPPLVFWINRQSMMAGGVILVPDNDLPHQLELGCATADALGLRHFVTWENDQVRIWDTTGTKASEEKQFSVTNGENPDAFRALLLEVMEQLKLLSVLGLVPAGELSSYYLQNLFQETLNSALDPLITAFRQTRAEGLLLETTRSDRQADQLNRLTLLRLLALLWHDSLPGSILPEKLERAMELALPSLPAELKKPLQYAQKKTGPALPIDSAVCYHHLQLRLRQISWTSPPERAVQAINQLLTPDDKSPNTDVIELEKTVPLLQLEPEAPLLGHPQLHELSDSPSFLASAALLRYINRLPAARQYPGTLFTFTTPPLPAARIQGKLVNRRRVPREERHHCDALLRTSWPTRRFKFPTDTPYWVLEVIHLLGLSPTQAQLELEIPSAWLTELFGQTLWELIIDSFQLQHIKLGKGTTILTLLKQKSVPTFTLVEASEEQRQIDWSEHPATNRSLLLFALLLASDQYRLLLSDQFQLEGRISTSSVIDAGLLCYAQSSLGQCLWNILGGPGMPHSAEELGQVGTELGWPVPCEEILYELGLPVSDGSEETTSQEQQDRRLSDLLGCSIPVEASCPQLPKLPGTPPTSRKGTNGNPREDILHHLDAFGVPDFPEQYLYQLENPQLTSYRFLPPLKIASELLGQFELIDAAQKYFTVQGELTVEALNLCAEQGRTEVELPESPQHLDDILTAYRNDLHSLRQELFRQTHIRLERPQVADRLAKKIWQELKLPSWKWLDH